MKFFHFPIPLKKPIGSIALISILVISAFTLILVIGMSEVSISTKYLSSNNLSRSSLQYIAEACLEESLIRMESSPSFSGVTLPFDDGSLCTVNVSGSNPYTFAISVNFLDYSENFNAQITLTTVGEVRNATLLTFDEI